MESSIPFHTVVNLIDAENITKENIRAPQKQLDVKKVTTNLESQNLSAETNNAIPQIMFTQPTDPNDRN